MAAKNPWTLFLAVFVLTRKKTDWYRTYIIPLELGTSALKSTGLSLTAQNNDYRLSPGLVCFPHTEFLIKAIKVWNTERTLYN